MNASQPANKSSPDVGQAAEQPGPPPAGATAAAYACPRSCLPILCIVLLCIMFAGVVALAVTVWWYTREPTAEDELPKDSVYALLRVASHEPALLFRSPEGDPERNFQMYKRTQEQLLKSEFVLRAVLRIGKVSNLPVVKRQDDPVAWLSRRLRVDFPGDAEIMRVSLEGVDPESAVALVNEVVNAYMREVVDKEKNERMKRLNELEEAYVTTENQVKKKWTELKQLAEKLGTSETGTLSMTQQIAFQEYTESRRELVPVRIELRQAESELKIQEALLSNADEIEVSELDLDAFMRSDAVAEQLFYQLNQVRQQLSDVDATTTAPAKAQYTEKFKRDLRALQDQLNMRRATLREELKQRQLATAKADVERLKVRIAVLSEQKDRIERDLEQQKDHLEQMSSSSIDIEMMRAEIEQLAKVLGGIAEEREILKVELRSAPRIQVVQPPHVPARKR